MTQTTYVTRATMDMAITIVTDLPPWKYSGVDPLPRDDTREMVVKEGRYGFSTLAPRAYKPSFCERVCGCCCAPTALTPLYDEKVFEKLESYLDSKTFNVALEIIPLLAGINIGKMKFEKIPLRIDDVKKIIYAVDMWGKGHDNLRKALRDLRYYHAQEGPMTRRIETALVLEDTPQIKVKTLDGKLEKFDKNKLINSLKALTFLAPVDDLDAIVTKVEGEIQSRHQRSSESGINVTEIVSIAAFVLKNNRLEVVCPHEFKGLDLHAEPLKNLFSKRFAALSGEDLHFFWSRKTQVKAPGDVKTPG